MRQFRDDVGVEWVVFMTVRSVAREDFLPEEYRQGWLTFESAQGEKRRLAPVPTAWEGLTGAELASLCAKAKRSVLRKKASAHETRVA